MITLTYLQFAALLLGTLFSGSGIATFIIGVLPKIRERQAMRQQQNNEATR